MLSLPNSNVRYKDVDYWDERYRSEERYEWFGDFSKIEHLLIKHVKAEENILVLGCGNSALSSDMCQAGYTSITNVDYSRVCVERMAQRHRSCAHLSWLCMDARRLAFPDGAFDVVLEKGTLDAMLVEETDPWKVSETGARLLHQVLTEVSRVLKHGGRFVSVTFAQPHFRKRLYARPEYGWSVRHYPYGSSFHYFLYVLTKGEELDPEDAAPRPAPPAEITYQDEDSEDFLSNIGLCDDPSSD